MLKVFLDLDGVLSDFVGRVEQIYHPFKVKCWDFVEHLPVSKKEFWESCNQDFWENLDWTPDGQDILNIVEGKFGSDNICILTSPCLTEGCREGKWKWIRNHLPKYWRQNMIGNAKEFLACQHKLLIDDNDVNCHDFCFDKTGEPTGGQSILIPRVYNRLSGKDVLIHLRESLEKFQGIRKSVFVGKRNGTSF